MGPFRKGVYSKGSKFSPFRHVRVDSFSDGNQNKFDTVASLESVSTPFKCSYKIKFLVVQYMNGDGMFGTSSSFTFLTSTCILDHHENMPI